MQALKDFTGMASNNQANGGVREGVNKQPLYTTLAGRPVSDDNNR